MLAIGFALSPSIILAQADIRLQETNGANDPEVTKDYSLCTNTADSKYLGAASVLETSNNPALGQVSKIKLVEFDNAYTVITTKRVEAQGYSLYPTSVKFDGSDYFICGYAIQNGSTVPYPFLIMYNSAFTLQYAKIYTWNGIPLDMDFYTNGTNYVVLVGAETANVDWASGTRKSTVRVILKSSGTNQSYYVLSLAGSSPAANNYVDCINDIVMWDSAGFIYGYVVCTASDNCSINDNSSKSYVVKLRFFSAGGVTIAPFFAQWAMPYTIGSGATFTGGAIERCGEHLIVAANEKDIGVPALACINLHTGGYVYTIQFEAPTPTTSNQGKLTTHIPYVQSISKIDNEHVLLTGKLIDAQFFSAPYNNLNSEMIWSTKVEIQANAFIFSEETIYLTEQDFPGAGPLNYTNKTGCGPGPMFYPMFTAKNTVEDLDNPGNFLTLTFDANMPTNWPATTQYHKTWLVTNHNTANCKYLDYSNFTIYNTDPPQLAVSPSLSSLIYSIDNDLNTIVLSNYTLSTLDCDNFPQP